MRTRSFLTFSVGVGGGITAVATVTEPHHPVMGNLTWPGTAVTFLVVLLLHVDYFRHPLLITCLDVLVNALLYTAIAVAIRRILHFVIGTT